jgi:hypothetical protein
MEFEHFSNTIKPIAVNYILLVLVGGGQSTGQSDPYKNVTPFTANNLAGFNYSYLQYLQRE